MSLSRYLPKAGPLGVDWRRAGRGWRYWIYGTTALGAGGLAFAVFVPRAQNQQRTKGIAVDLKRQMERTRKEIDAMEKPVKT